MRHLLSALAFAAAAVPGAASAQTIYSGTSNLGQYSATFSITTFSTITTPQVLHTADVESWTITLTGNGSTYTHDNNTPNSAFTITGDDLTADGAGLRFDYSGSGSVNFFNQSTFNQFFICACAPGYDYIALNGGGDSGARSGEQQIADAVPEPGAWIMMIGGFALAGSAVRMRRLRRMLAA